MSRKYEIDVIVIMATTSQPKQYESVVVQVETTGKPKGLATPFDVFALLRRAKKVKLVVEL